MNSSIRTVFFMFVCHDVYHIMLSRLNRASFIEIHHRHDQSDKTSHITTTDLLVSHILCVKCYLIEIVHYI
jgi:hypothetical protein